MRQIERMSTKFQQSHCKGSLNKTNPVNECLELANCYYYEAAIRFVYIYVKLYKWKCEQCFSGFSLVAALDDIRLNKPSRLEILTRRDIHSCQFITRIVHII